MSLKRLVLKNFRNHSFYEVNLHSGITIFTGPNGAGKTSILEAVALLGSSRSFRQAKSGDFILRGQLEARVTGFVDRSGLQDTIHSDLLESGKKFYVNEKYLRSSRGLLELLPYVVFSPSDHHIIEGDSGDRKQFLNRALSGYFPSYADLLSQFNKTLLQRNQWLKRQSRTGNTNFNESELEIWDQSLINNAQQIIHERDNYINALRPKIQQEYVRIAKNADQIDIIYEPLGMENLKAEEAIKNYPQLLHDSRRRDIILETTSLGPHKDEIQLILNGNKVKFYGSQGEKRSYVLALRLGEVALFRERQKRIPLLLVDDVSSELDSDRRQALVELLRNDEVQVLMTATELPAALVESLDRPFTHVSLA